MSIASLQTHSEGLAPELDCHGYSRRSVNSGIFTVPLACAVSLLFLPSDSTTPGSLLWPAWILAAGMLGSVLMNALQKGARRLYRAEHVLMIAIVVVVFAEVLQPWYAVYFDSETLRKEFLAIGLFATMVALGELTETA